MADRIKDVGFGYATQSGTSIAMSDLIVPPKKYEILETAEKQVGEVERQFRRGLLTDDEQYTRTIELWTDARDEVESAVDQGGGDRGSKLRARLKREGKRLALLGDDDRSADRAYAREFLLDDDLLRRHQRNGW